MYKKIVKRKNGKREEYIMDSIIVKKLSGGEGSITCTIDEVILAHGRAIAKYSHMYSPKLRGTFK